MRWRGEDSNASFHARVAISRWLTDSMLKKTRYFFILHFPRGPRSRGLGVANGVIRMKKENKKY